MVFHTDLNLLHRNDKQQIKTTLELKLNWTPGQQMRGYVGKCQTRKQKVLEKILWHSSHERNPKWHTFCPAGHFSEQQEGSGQ